MRKREIEKLLYDAVAGALGVEASPKAKATPLATRKARKPQHQAHTQQRAAA